ncbi:MAG: methyltransferase domain-containing protein [Oscillospiraceae bacterium]|nr:methyltransferase domain-containing protein [Oscillospiraceae bacterium]
MTACLHPGGAELTEKLLHMAALPYGARILDLGCGKGTTVARLQLSGYDAFGIDVQEAAQPCGETGKLRRLSAFPKEDARREGKKRVSSGRSGPAAEEASRKEVEGGWETKMIRGDMRHLPFADESFDAVLAECSLSVCGGREEALKESFRVLRSCGTILVSDLFFPETDGPGAEQWAAGFQKAGFTRLKLDFATDCVQEYFFRYIWEHGTLPEAWKKAAAGRKKVGYALFAGRKT